MDMNKAANGATVLVGACVVLFTAAHFLRGGVKLPPPPPPPLPDSVLVEEWEKYLEGGHSRGPATADVTILEFGDYECPFCARFAGVADGILAAFPGRVRFVYRHWPLPNHRFAYPAARAAECAAAQGKFWEVHDMLYAKRDSLGLITFADFAKRAGVADLERFGSCYRSSAPVPSIEAGIRDAQAAGGRGTPTLIVNGVLKRRGLDSIYIESVLANSGRQ
jgi:protein-disulfide isomerase